MSTSGADFLYPFIEETENALEPLLTDLVASARSKSLDSQALRAATIERFDKELNILAAKIAERFDEGGRLFTFGNGGSSTDAMCTASLFAQPPARIPLPARSLVADQAILSALGNDVGFDLIFSRQLIAYARPGDIAVGFSTSGNSPNLLAAFQQAKRIGVLTCGFAGYRGGAMAACDELDYCFVVDSDSVHRIQEAQAALAFELWSSVQDLLEQACATQDPVTK